MELKEVVINMGWAISSAEAKRLVMLGAVEVDGEKITNPHSEIKENNKVTIKRKVPNFIPPA